MIGVVIDLLLVNTGLGTQQESLDLGNRTQKQGLLLDNGIGKHVLYLKQKNSRFERVKG
jgi:hypothetical protein